ncbi:hypothetical protein FEZ18_14225 [Oceanihabitans sp. IOP_32]|uniref:hypothetical protein n=1 Tax=Oceanihabitans sp. IOP_32 TaxID=2529032 RepID=UPI001292CE4A|nr:hypothetical protein [Oceanihabitans sp. IOP_32]QFZ55877.1 hypothetical protein FEZ18_14225 [Oceanihabitans sp. IOP_32]
MKVKKVYFVVIIMALMSFTQKSFSQNPRLWFSENGVEFYVNYVPKKGSEYAYYYLTVINKRGTQKLIYYYPVFVHNNKITGESLERTFRLAPGESRSETFYISTQLLIQSGDHIPKLTFKKYYVKDVN